MWNDMVQNKFHLKQLTAAIRNLIKIVCTVSVMKFMDEITNSCKRHLQFAFPFLHKFKISHKMINTTIRKISFFFFFHSVSCDCNHLHTPKCRSGNSNCRKPHNSPNWDKSTAKQLGQQHTFCQNTICTKKNYYPCFFVKETCSHVELLRTCRHFSVSCRTVYRWVTTS